MLRRRPPSRAGVAAVEVAVITAFFLVPLVIGVWEVGRLVQVQQIVSNSAREGARLAAQGYTINTSGTPIQVMVTTGSPNVTDVVYRYLIGAGLTNLLKSDVDVQLRFLPGNVLLEPYLGVKGQSFTVTVTIPWDKVRWINLGVVNPTTVTFVVTWQMLVDDTFTVNETLPIW